MPRNVYGRLDKLEQQVALLIQEIATLKQQLPAPNPPPPSAFPPPEAEGLSPPIPALVARWLAEHGAHADTARAWFRAGLPLDDYLGALRFTKQRLDAAAKARSQQRSFHRCRRRRCPCQTMKETKPGLTRHDIAIFLERHGANYNTVLSVGWRHVPLDYRGSLLFAQNKIYGSGGAAACARGVNLHCCEDLTCVCYEVLESWRAL